MNINNVMEMSLNSAEIKQERRKIWDDFFSRVEESSTSNIDIPISSLDPYNISSLSDDTQSKLSVPKRNIYRGGIKTKNNNFSYRFKKSRKRINGKFKGISKNWRKLYKIVFNNYNVSEKYRQLHNKNDKVEDTNGKDESNITFNLESSLINSHEEKTENYDSSVSGTNLCDTPNNHIQEIKCIQSKNENFNNFKILKSIDSCDIENKHTNLIQKSKYVEVVLEKLHHSKNICKGIHNINGKEKDNYKEPQTDTYIGKSIECKENINSINTCNKLLESRPCNEETKCKNVVELCDKLQCPKLQNDIQGKQEIKTTKSYYQETNNSIYSTNKRKNYNEVSDTFEQIKKKRKTMTLLEFINQSGTGTTSTTEKQKRKKIYSYGSINNQINYNDIVIPLTLEDFLNSTF